MKGKKIVALIVLVAIGFAATAPVTTHAKIYYPFDPISQK